ncbi:hypothetical protein PV325_010907 [Microctonus aethiopoides]|nr:hypothetical protein PV325_010907 [Microctonus aethiopoides]
MERHSRDGVVDTPGSSRKNNRSSRVGRKRHSECLGGRRDCRAGRQMSTVSPVFGPILVPDSGDRAAPCQAWRAPPVVGELFEGNARHHERVRKALEANDDRRNGPPPEVLERNRITMDGFLRLFFIQNKPNKKPALPNESDDSAVWMGEENDLADLQDPV